MKRALRKEQQKIAEDFFKRLKENFDDRQFATWSNTFMYKSWSFNRSGDMFVYLDTITHQNRNNETKIYIRANRFLKIKIHSFLKKQKRIKDRKEKLAALHEELEPTKLQVEKTFSQPATEIFESLNN